MAWRRDDARVMPAGSEQESHFYVGQDVDLVHRAPRRHMIANSRDRKNRRPNVCQGNRVSVYEITPSRL